MGEREPVRAQPDGAPPAAQGWYARMERQSAPPSQAGPPPAGGAPPPGGTPQRPPPTVVLPTAAPGTRPKGRPSGRRRRPTGRPPGRKSNRDLVWWALAALVLGAAAVAAILLGDDPSGTSAAGAEATATDQAGTTEQTSPSADGATETPTGTTAPTTASSAGQDPLGLGVPMAPPACDGTWIVILGSAIDPATYPADVSASLATDPSAKYVLTAGQCPSLRQQTDEGNQIYAVYLGPFPDQATACATSTGVGGGAYVKQMDPSIPPEQTWEC